MSISSFAQSLPTFVLKMSAKAKKLTQHGNETDCSMAYCPCNIVSFYHRYQPRFQANIPSNRRYIARIFQNWLTPIGWAGALSQSEWVKYFERIIEKYQAASKQWAMVRY